MAGRERDRELLLPVVAGEHAAAGSVDDDVSEPTTPVVMAGPPPPPLASGRALHVLHHHHPTGIEVMLFRLLFLLVEMNEICSKNFVQNSPNLYCIISTAMFRW